MNDTQTNFIIFSKDRACQLHACIESLQRYFRSETDPTVTVIYKASSPEFDKGYQKLQEAFPGNDNFVWEAETNFKHQTVKAVKGFPWAASQFTIFLVDDIIFVNNVSTEDQQFSLIKNNSMMVGLSLRLHDGVNHCYATNEAQNVPKFVKKFVWAWDKCGGDWGYPMSVDGNVYNTDFISSFIETLNYHNPNSLEAALDSVKSDSRVPSYLCCYPESPRLINVPANRVQNTYQNRFADGYTAEELNKLYLDGQTIDIDAYQGIKPNTVHVPIELKFRGEAKYNMEVAFTG